MLINAFKDDKNILRIKFTDNINLFVAIFLNK